MHVITTIKLGGTFHPVMVAFYSAIAQHIARSTVLEGSFGTEKEHYSLKKVRSQTKNNEILWILFGIHSANLSRLAIRLFKMSKELKRAA